MNNEIAFNKILLACVFMLLTLFVIVHQELFGTELTIHIPRLVGEPIPVHEEIVPHEEVVEEVVVEEPVEEIAYELVKLDLPDKYYPGMDFSTMQPYMSYKAITNKQSPAYKICNGDRAYTDANGYRRYKVSEDQYSIDGKDDYVVALGTYYKDKGTCGQRYLIVTSGGSYTVITGDEKADADTDAKRMVHDHGNGRYSLVEWIVDTNTLESGVKRMGSVYYSSIPELSGDILEIYEIR